MALELLSKFQFCVALLKEPLPPFSLALTPEILSLVPPVLNHTFEWLMFQERSDQVQDDTAGIWLGKQTGVCKNVGAGIIVRDGPYCVSNVYPSASFFHHILPTTKVFHI